MAQRVKVLATNSDRVQFSEPFSFLFPVSYHLNLLFSSQVFPPRSFYTLLVSVVIPYSVLTSEDLELRTTDELGSGSTGL